MTYEEKQEMIKARATGSEAGHWYNASGLVEQVPNAKGDKMKKPTLADAKKLGLLPSCTGVLGILDKPALTVWKIKEHIKAIKFAGLKKKDESDDTYFLRVSEAMQRTNDQAKVGTEIHGEIYKAYLHWFEYNQEQKYDKIAEKTIQYLVGLYSEYKAKFGAENVAVEAELPFANYSLGFGGTVDFKFITPEFVHFIDFKSTDDEKLVKGDDLAYKDSHFAQLVAYWIGTDINGRWSYQRNSEGLDFKASNVFVGRIEGDIHIKDWDMGENDSELVWTIRYFRKLLDLYRHIKGFDKQTTNRA